MPSRFPNARFATLYAQPLEVAVALILLLVGIGTWFNPEATPDSIAELQWPWTILFRLLMVIGGAFVLLGALPRRRWSTSTEMLGMAAMGIVFSTYAGGLIDDGTDKAALAAVGYGIVAAACYLKAYTLRLESKSKLARIRRMPSAPEGV